MQQGAQVTSHATASYNTKMFEKTNSLGVFIFIKDSVPKSFSFS